MSNCHGMMGWTHRPRFFIVLKFITILFTMCAIVLHRSKSLRGGIVEGIFGGCRWQSTCGRWGALSTSYLVRAVYSSGYPGLLQTIYWILYHSASGRGKECSAEVLERF